MQSTEKFSHLVQWQESETECKRYVLNECNKNIQTHIQINSVNKYTHRNGAKLWIIFPCFVHGAQPEKHRS